MDPAFYGSNRPQAIVFRYDEDTREISGDRYNVTVGDDGSITVNTGIGGRTKNNIDASVLEDRLRDLFRDVTITTPLFNDPDRNYVLGYYKSKETILPFSLDTDWIEANATIRRKLKEQ
jgi:hypothetical protein